MTIIKLKTPVKHGEEEITELKFRKPIAKDLRNFNISDLNNFGKTIQISSILTGLPESIVASIDGGDLMKCHFVIDNFFLNSLEVLGNI